MASWARAAENGMVTVKSAYSVKETLDRFAVALKEKSVNVIARVNHTEAAKKVGMELRPTEVLISVTPGPARR